MDIWRKMRDCECGVIDRSPCVNPPFCLIFGEDFDCDLCTATDGDKNIAIAALED